MCSCVFKDEGNSGILLCHHLGLEASAPIWSRWLNHLCLRGIASFRVLSVKDGDYNMSQSTWVPVSEEHSQPVCWLAIFPKVRNQILLMAVFCICLFIVLMGQVSSRKNQVQSHISFPNPTVWSSASVVTLLLLDPGCRKYKGNCWPLCIVGYTYWL